jgi:hypothetical protein
MDRGELECVRDVAIPSLLERLLASMRGRMRGLVGHDEVAGCLSTSRAVGSTPGILMATEQARTPRRRQDATFVTDQDPGREADLRI